jgi:small subunit ribosomal protein S21
MLKVEVKKGNINRALKEMKFKVRKTKQLQRIRDIQYFQKPSMKKRLQLEKAIRREQKSREEE